MSNQPNNTKEEFCIEIKRELNINGSYEITIKDCDYNPLLFPLLFSKNQGDNQGVVCQIEQKPILSNKQVLSKPIPHDVNIIILCLLIGGSIIFRLYMKYRT